MMEKQQQKAWVEKHMGLVDMYVKKYRVETVLEEDLRQEGYLGLIRAARTYDSEKSLPSTYACHWISAYIRRYIDNHRTVVRYPVYVWNMARQHTRTQQKKYQLTGEGGAARSEVLDLALPPLGWDDSAGVSVSGAPSPAAQTRYQQRNQKLRELIEELEPRYQETLFRYFGFFEGREETLSEIGKNLKSHRSITRERVRQIKRSALSVLRRNIEAAGLLSFFTDGG